MKIIIPIRLLFIVDSDSGLTENLLLSLQKDNSYKAFLITYSFTEEEKEIIRNNGYVDVTTEGKMSWEEISIDVDNIFSKVYDLGDGVYWNSDLNYCFKYINVISQGTGWDIASSQEQVTCPWDVSEEIDAGDSATGGDDTSNSNDGIPDTSGDNDADTSGGETSDSTSGSNNNDTVNSDDDDDCIKDVNGNCVNDVTTPKVKPKLVVDCSSTDENFNEYYSNFSPFNVDLSEVRENCSGNTIDTTQVAANEKFMCIYNKLTQSPKFKNLILDTFQESKELNIQFKVSDTLSTNGLCVPGTISVNNENNEIVSASMQILISKSYMEGASAIAVARTILHESLHAYLVVKQYGCDQSTPFEDMGDEEMAELLNEYFTECEPQEGQHEFMFNFMITTMTSILGDLKDDLIPQSHQQGAESYLFINEDNPTTDANGDYVTDTLWNWDDFYKYLSLGGLQNSSAFHFTYPDNPPSAGYMNFLSYLQKGEDLFLKNCQD